MAELAVEVIVQIEGEDVLAGRLWARRRRNAESATFAYDDAYLARRGAYALDPALPLATGQQQASVGRSTFGAFSDCAPDRWGRRLIDRAARQEAKRGGGAARSFDEVDYLLGVRDDLRQGALRFRRPGSAAYLSEDGQGVPPLLELPRLLGAADRLERDQAGDEDLMMLLRGGSSLGGARPKAHVVNGNGKVAIAKFPSAGDGWEVTRWEEVALRLARAAGVEVSASRLHIVDGKPVLVVTRFDRAGAVRIGYVSAMTMLEASDGDSASYLEIADVIRRDSPAVIADLRQLWRRVAFTILISNTDDHLRNHGFLRRNGAGWSLAPAFDLNPDPQPGPKLLSTAIDFDDHAASVETLLGLAADFELDAVAASDILREVGAATQRWRTVAEEVGCRRDEIALMASAFEHGELRRARELTA
jgi:serine/threonine-protein kinase HipA